jgi:histidinol-phosphate phosphatase family protein
MKLKALFLDRDGTLNYDPGYLSNPADMALFSDVGPALAAARDLGYSFFVFTNQSGVGRGLITETALDAVHFRMEEILAKHGVVITGYLICKHHPDDGCDCRKPSAKLIKEAAAKYSIDLKKSFMIGDRSTDVEAGKNAGIKTVFIQRDLAVFQKTRPAADFLVRSLLDLSSILK